MKEDIEKTISFLEDYMYIISHQDKVEILAIILGYGTNITPTEEDILSEIIRKNTIL